MVVTIESNGTSACLGETAATSAAVEALINTDVKAAIVDGKAVGLDGSVNALFAARLARLPVLNGRLKSGKKCAVAVSPAVAIMVPPLKLRVEANWLVPDMTKPPPETEELPFMVKVVVAPVAASPLLRFRELVPSFICALLFNVRLTNLASPETDQVLPPARLKPA